MSFLRVIPGIETLSCFANILNPFPVSPELANWLRIPAPSIPSHEYWDRGTAVEWSKSMIGLCTHEHSHLKENFRPKRLIDIQTSPIRLLKSEALESPVTYVALSYCWGSELDSQAQLRTDSDEMEEQLSLGFDEKRLPAVVRDAVEVSRSLSIPYLWVDALCIRQDKPSVSDWEEHAGIMHRIYGNAYLTIAATCSSSCNEGFLRRKEPAVYLKYRSTLRHSMTGLLKMTFQYAHHSAFRKLDLSIQHKTASYAAETFARSKWSTRGWTFQEHISSTRILAFGFKGNIFFSCPVGYWCFGREREASELRYTRQLGLDWSSFATDPSTGLSGWWWIVSAYSDRSRGFTNEGDIFPALSGIARSYSTVVNIPETDYIAGFWRPSLLRDLFWFSANHFNDKPWSQMNLLESRASQDFVSPSWSRFYCGYSYPCISACQNLTLKSEYQRMDTRIVHKGEDLLGAISAAELHIVGKMARAPCDRILRVNVRRRLPGDVQPWTPDLKGGHPWHFYLDWRPQQDPADFSEVYMLLMASFDLIKRDQSGGGGRGLLGLLLLRLPSDSTEGSRFRRAGVFRTATRIPQPLGSGMELFRECADELLVVV